MAAEFSTADQLVEGVATQWRSRRGSWSSGSSWLCRSLLTCLHYQLLRVPAASCVDSTLIAISICYMKGESKPEPPPHHLPAPPPERGKKYQMRNKDEEASFGNISNLDKSVDLSAASPWTYRDAYKSTPSLLQL